MPLLVASAVPKGRVFRRTWPAIWENGNNWPNGVRVAPLLESYASNQTVAPQQGEVDILEVRATFGFEIQELALMHGAGRK
jgi:hypothetical protein